MKSIEKMSDSTFTRRQFLGTIGSGFLGASFSGNESENVKDGEFKSLFNGKNLEGWHTNVEEISHGDGGRWQVENGIITGQQDPPGSGNGGILMTDQEYGDFELLVEAAPDWGICSGIFLRTNSKGECFQVYLDYRENGNIGYISTETPTGEDRMFIRPYNFFSEGDEEGEVDRLVTKPDPRDIAWDPEYLEYSATPGEAIEAWNIGGWNTIRIRCVGKYPRISTWINYTKIAEFDGTTRPHPRYDREEMFRKLDRKGSIALQVHGGTDLWEEGAKCRWNNIKVRSL